MGKKRGKKKSEFDDIFSKPAENEWLSGVSAMAMDEDVAGVAAAPGATGAGAKADAMDVNDGNSHKAQGLGLGVQHNSMKINKRGNRTTVQKKRKMQKQEKALARLEKTQVKVAGFSSKKMKKTELKHIY